MSIVLRLTNMVIYHGSLWVTQKGRIFWGHPGLLPTISHRKCSRNQSKFPLAWKECVSTIKNRSLPIIFDQSRCKAASSVENKQNLGYWILECHPWISDPQAFKISEQGLQPNHFLLLMGAQLMSTAVLLVTQHPPLSPSQLFLRPQLFSVLAPSEISVSCTLMVVLFVLLS